MAGGRRWAVGAVAALAVAGLLLPSAASTAATRADGLVTGLTVPWAVGGPRIEADGTRVEFPGEWPTIPFDAIRLWDTRTAWLNIEPRDGLWDFARLDRFVAKAQARGVRDISLVLAGTPRWAAAQVRPTDAPWLGRGSASPPRRMADWAEFVTTVAERYRGRITSYEVWNEPNNPTFWSGTPRQWAALVDVAAAAISRADPAATIVVGGFSAGGTPDLDRLDPWLTALGTAVGGPAPTVDAVSLHWYPRAGSDLTALTPALRDLQARARAAGLPTRTWVSEANVRRGARLPATAQVAAVRTLSDAARAGGAERLVWYAWTDLGPADLMPLYPRTPAGLAVGAEASSGGD